MGVDISVWLHAILVGMWMALCVAEDRNDKEAVAAKFEALLERRYKALVAAGFKKVIAVLDGRSFLAKGAVRAERNKCVRPHAAAYARALSADRLHDRNAAQHQAKAIALLSLGDRTAAATAFGKAHQVRGPLGHGEPLGRLNCCL